MGRRSATLRDIAERAGVSTATVSRALARPGLVAGATREAVMAAVRETGYRPNIAARNLRAGRTGSVVALVPNLANPFFSQILAGLTAALTPAGYGLLIADTEADPEPGAALARYVESGLADGLVLLDGALPREPLDQAPRPPVVMACEWMEGAGLPSVTVDNPAAAALAVRHLAARGHARIGHLTGPRGNVLSEARLAGWRAALAGLGLERRREWVIEGDFGLNSGAFAAAAWRALDPRPTALFCASDEMALGLVGAVRRMGLAVPGDVSVVGFDDIEVAGHLVPGLTTIRQPRRRIGERAARLLLGMIEEGRLDGPSEVVETSLVERGSVGGPAG